MDWTFLECGSCRRLRVGLAGGICAWCWRARGASLRASLYGVGRKLKAVLALDEPARTYEAKALLAVLDVLGRHDDGL
jgi:hypothetical protein